MVATRKPVCVHFWSRRVHVSQVDSDSAPPTVRTKLSVALQFTMYSGLDNAVVVINNEVAMFTSLMGPAKRLVPVSTKAENVVPNGCTIELPAVQNSLAALSKLAYAKSFVHCALLTPARGLKCPDEHASPKLLNGWASPHSL